MMARDKIVPGDLAVNVTTSPVYPTSLRSIEAYEVDWKPIGEIPEGTLVMVIAIDNWVPPSQRSVAWQDPDDRNLYWSYAQVAWEARLVWLKLSWLRKVQP